MLHFKVNNNKKRPKDKYLPFTPTIDSIDSLDVRLCNSEMVRGKCKIQATI